MGCFFRISAFVACLNIVLVEQAYAYIDPGTGSMLLQALLACLVAVIAFGRQIWARISGFLPAQKGSLSDDEPHKGQG